MRAMQALRNLSLKKIRNIIRRIHRSMPEHESDLSLVDKHEGGGDPASSGEAGFDSAAPEAATVPSGGPAETDVAVGRTEYEQLKGERDQLVDRVARLQAEFENARKRNEREKADYRDYATGNVVEQFLPVLDNFELALKAQGSAEQLRSGVELIVKQMEEVLRQLNVTPIAAVGAEFDPRYHEALGSVERDDLPDHFVAEEIRRGYKLRERLLRPSMVRVVSNPKQQKE
jgi:molecular chaperone GrpE